MTDFGADPGDNGHDDTAAMQRAADELCRPENAGATLRYPPGVYNVDRVVDTATITADPRTWTILYDKCRNVRITGRGARVEVAGDFTRTAVTNYPGTEFWATDRQQTTPFYFQDADGLEMTGFEIDGNVERMKQQVPAGGKLAEASEHGVHIGGSIGNASRRVVLADLRIHSMATDGILLGSGRDVEIRHVISANNVRQALTIGQGRNVLVTASELRDTGVVGTAVDSYPVHSPARGVDIEPECTPKGAEWAPYDGSGNQIGACNDVVGVTGNILFDRVRVTGNLGGGIAMAHGEASANVTVRNSFLQNPLERSGDVVDMGIVGGIVENSTLDSQNGFALWCVTAGSPAQLTSPTWARYLRDLANDPSPIARRVYRQTDPVFSTTVRNSLIEGQGTKIRCESATPVLRLLDNTIRGTVLNAPPEPQSPPDERVFPKWGHMIVLSGTPGAECSTGRDWGKELTIRGNRIHIPQAAPRGGTYGQISYCGTRLRLADNSYTTDTDTASDPLRVYYNRAQGVGSVTGDCFPRSGAITAVDEAGLPYPLTPRGTRRCLTLPQP
ncbi:hypothetical protein ACWGB8_22900 [Kitasatospora sp. NPDC054939]